MAVVRAALAASDAGLLVRQTLASPDMRGSLRKAAAVDLVAVGKAARAMLTAAVESAADSPLRHVVGVSSQPAIQLPRGARWFRSAHPVPDDRSVTAARAVLNVASAADERDMLVVLLSGGASALMALPAEGVSLQDKQVTSQRLLSEGTEVHALNTVRKHLSGIKGGHLAAKAGSPVLTLAVSDVVGDDLSSIGSGPTVADATTFRDSLAILNKYGGRDRYPDTVVKHLLDGARGAIAETPKPGDPRMARSMSIVIGSGRTAVEGARVEAASRGYTVHVVDQPILGEARAAGRNLLDRAGRLVRSHTAKHCILASGETTVRVSGKGKGGRNQECALAMASGIGALGRAAVAASVGTDGVDGPTDAAGGLVDSTTLTRASAAGIDAPETYLDDNNSYAFFDALGDSIRTGPTDTNVGDLYIILVDNS